MSDWEEEFRKMRRTLHRISAKLCSTSAHPDALCKRIDELGIRHERLYEELHARALVLERLNVDPESINHNNWTGEVTWSPLDKEEQ